MNIINVGDPRTIILLAGQTISVTTTGTITATCVSGLGLTAGATIGSIHGSTVFGSYSADGVIKLTAANRDGAYELNTDTSAAIKSVTATTGLAAFDAASKGAVLGSIGPMTQQTIGIGVVGDSRYANINVDGPKVVRTSSNWLNVALQLAGQPGRLLYQGGVTAERTDQFAARVTIAAGMSSLTDVYIKGGVNDHSQQYPTATTSGATAAANLIAYCKQLLAAGKRVFIEEEEGIDANWVPSIAAATADHALQCAIQNALVKSFCESTKGATYIEFSPVIFDRSAATSKFLLGVKYDGTHDATGIALVKAQYFIAKYPTALPFAKPIVVPSLSNYSTDPAAPNQILANPGCTTRTGGSITAATIASWVTGTAYAANSVKINGGNAYFTAAGGTSGATAPVHTSGTITDGAVLWRWLCAVPANTLPQYWACTAGSGATFMCTTEVNPDNGIDMLVLGVFTNTAGSNVQLNIGSDLISGFTGRFQVGGTYELQATVQIDEHINMGAASLQWNRGDAGSAPFNGNPPADGYATSGLWTDNQTSPRYTGQLGTYPYAKTLRTVPYTAESQATPGTIATWNMLRVKVEGAGAAGQGYAIFRVRDAKIVRVS